MSTDYLNCDVYNRMYDNLNAIRQTIAKKKMNGFKIGNRTKNGLISTKSINLFILLRKPKVLKLNRLSSSFNIRV